MKSVWEIIGVPEGLCLHIGCGADLRPGFINIDKYEESDVNWDIFHLPLKKESVNVIVANDLLEHFGHFEIVPLLTEWNRVLKHGAALFLCIPELTATCKLMLEDPDSFLNLARIYGLQTSPGQFHKTNFTFKSIHTYLLKSGFTKIFMGGYIAQDMLGRIFVEARK